MNKKRSMIFSTALIGAVGIASAENLVGVDEMICAAGQAQICLETGECYAALPSELSLPEFVVIDTKKQTISTTRSSGLNRSTAFSSYSRGDGLINLQGVQSARAFSFVIHEATGRMTVGLALDGLTVSVFGVCTDTNL